MYETCKSMNTTSGNINSSPYCKKLFPKFRGGGDSPPPQYTRTACTASGSENESSASKIPSIFAKVSSHATSNRNASEISNGFIFSGNDTDAATGLSRCIKPVIKKSLIPSAPNFMPNRFAEDLAKLPNDSSNTNNDDPAELTSSPHRIGLQGRSLPSSSTKKPNRPPGSSGISSVAGTAQRTPTTNSDFFVSIYTPTTPSKNAKIEKELPKNGTEEITRSTGCNVKAAAAARGGYVPPARFETYLMTGDVILNVDPKSAATKVTGMGLSYNGDQEDYIGRDNPLKSTNTYLANGIMYIDPPKLTTAGRLPTNAHAQGDIFSCTKTSNNSTSLGYVSGQITFDPYLSSDQQKWPDTFNDSIRFFDNNETLALSPKNDDNSFGSGETYIQEHSSPAELLDANNNNYFTTENNQKCPVPIPSTDTRVTHIDTDSPYHSQTTPDVIPNSNNTHGELVPERNSKKIKALRESVERHRLRSRGGSGHINNNFSSHSSLNNTNINNNNNNSSAELSSSSLPGEAIIANTRRLESHHHPLSENTNSDGQGDGGGDRPLHINVGKGKQRIVSSSCTTLCTTKNYSTESCGVLVNEENSHSKQTPQSTAVGKELSYHEELLSKPPSYHPLSTINGPLNPGKIVDESRQRPQRVSGSSINTNKNNSSKIRRKNPQEFAVWTINNDRDTEIIAACASAKSAFRYNNKPSDSEGGFSDSFEDSSTTKSRSGSLLLATPFTRNTEEQRRTSERIAKIEERRAMAHANKAKKLQNSAAINEDLSTKPQNINFHQDPRSFPTLPNVTVTTAPTIKGATNHNSNESSTYPPKGQVMTTPETTTTTTTYNVKNEYFVIERETAERFLSAFTSSKTAAAAPSTAAADGYIHQAVSASSSIPVPNDANLYPMSPTTRNTSYRNSILNNCEGGRMLPQTSFPVQTNENSKSSTQEEYESLEQLFLRANGNKYGHGVDILEEPKIVRQMYMLDGLDKLQVAYLLNRMIDTNEHLVQAYFNEFAYEKVPLDAALRNFFAHVSLVGDTCDKEKTLKTFSRYYYQFNPTAYISEDALHILVCALVLLNTDFYICNIGKKMSCKEFITNLESLGPYGKSYNKAILTKLYYSVKEKPLQGGPAKRTKTTSSAITPNDTSPLKLNNKSCITGVTNAENRNNSSCYHMDNSILLSSVGGANNVLYEQTGISNKYLQENMYLTVPPPASIKGDVIVKQGFLRRKCHQEPSGRRSSFIRRNWKTFFATLRGRVLYLNKCGNITVKDNIGDDYNSIRLHHALATKASEYGQKPFVFQLQTADWAIFYFQAGNQHELAQWIESINLVAASFSAHPNILPSPIQGGRYCSYKLDNISNDLSPSKGSSIKKFLSGSNLPLSASSALSTPSDSIKTASAGAPFCYTPSLLPKRTQAVKASQINNNKSLLSQNNNHHHHLKRFHKPLLPSLPTKYNTRDQLEQHEMKVRELEAELQILRETPPAPQWKTREILDYKERENYYLYELKRYKTYATILQRKLAYASTNNNKTILAANNDPPLRSQSSDVVSASKLAIILSEDKKRYNHEINVVDGPGGPFTTLTNEPMGSSQPDYYRINKSFLPGSPTLPTTFYNGGKNGAWKDSVNLTDKSDMAGAGGEPHHQGLISQIISSAKSKQKHGAANPTAIATSGPVTNSNAEHSELSKLRDRYSYKAAIYKTEMERNYF